MKSPLEMGGGGAGARTLEDRARVSRTAFPAAPEREPQGALRPQPRPHGGGSLTAADSREPLGLRRHPLPNSATTSEVAGGQP